MKLLGVDYRWKCQNRQIMRLETTQGAKNKTEAEGSDTGRH